MPTSLRAPLPDTDWIRTWARLAEIAWSAPIVIGYRTGRMLMGGWPPSAEDSRELTRMWQEKVDAFSRASLALMTTSPQHAGRAAKKAVGPVHRRVVANHRRLTR